MLPHFGFLTLAETERRRARRERNGPSTGPPGQQAKSASFRRNPRISVGLPALWQKAYPNLPSPKFRFWVIFNNQFRPVPVVTAPNWVAVISRSLETSSRAATATAVRHLFAMSEISRLKRKAEVEVVLCPSRGLVSPRRRSV